MEDEVRVNLLFQSNLILILLILKFFFFQSSKVKVRSIIIKIKFNFDLLRILNKKFEDPHNK